ncbi:hypothetical protein AC579_8702, partial [Pseudocercospora musae]
GEIDIRGVAIFPEPLVQPAAPFDLACYQFPAPNIRNLHSDPPSLPQALSIPTLPNSHSSSGTTSVPNHVPLTSTKLLTNPLNNPVHSFMANLSEQLLLKLCGASGRAGFLLTTPSWSKFPLPSICPSCLTAQGVESSWEDIGEGWVRLCVFLASGTPFYPRTWVLVSEAFFREVRTLIEEEAIEATYREDFGVRVVKDVAV